MKFQMFTLALLVINACFFQPTNQYRLSKRELTEYDLTSFIVNTCSADTKDMYIQDLCDQTSHSALMGNFPILIQYCSTIGIKMTYCNNINRQAAINQNTGTKRSGYRRLLRSLSKDQEVNQKEKEIDNEVDPEQKLIIQLCITKTEKTLIDVDEFCIEALKNAQQRQYPDIEYFCQHHPGIDYCQHILSYSLLSSWPLSQSSSLLSSSSTNSVTASIYPGFTPSSTSKPAKMKSFIDQKSIKTQNSLLSSSLS